MWAAGPRGRMGGQYRREAGGRCPSVSRRRWGSADCSLRVDGHVPCCDGHSAAGVAGPGGRSCGFDEPDGDGEWDLGGEDHSVLAGMGEAWPACPEECEECFSFDVSQCMDSDSGAVTLSGGDVDFGSGAVFVECDVSQCLDPDNGSAILGGGADSSGSGAVCVGGGADPICPMAISDSGGTGDGAVPQVIIVSAGLC